MKTLFTLCALVLALSAPAADIVALVIGNNAYTRVEDTLDTPINDATLMKRTLEALPGGADVKILTDATKESIEIALNALKVRAQGAKLALVFYSGHGTEDQPDGFAQNETFLLPVDATIPDVNYLPTRAVSLSTVLAALKAAPVTARAVILDCCRNGAPKATAALASSTKSFGTLDERVKKALGNAVVPDATLIAFAASPGRKAAAFLTETDENSPFTKILCDELTSGTGNLRDIVEAASETTELKTGGRQVPYVSYVGAASAIRQITFAIPALHSAQEMPNSKAASAPAEHQPTSIPGSEAVKQKESGSIDPKVVWTKLSDAQSKPFRHLSPDSNEFFTATIKIGNNITGIHATITNAANYTEIWQRDCKFEWKALQRDAITVGSSISPGKILFDYYREYDEKYQFGRWQTAQRAPNAGAIFTVIKKDQPMPFFTTGSAGISVDSIKPSADLTMPCWMFSYSGIFHEYASLESLMGDEKAKLANFKFTMLVFAER